MNSRDGIPSRCDRPLAIVFDLDDTLYLEADYTRSGLRAVGEAFARELGAADLTDRLLRCFESGERRHIYDQVLTDLGFAGDVEEVVGRMVARHREHRPAIALLPDADEALAWWGPLANLGLISDGYWVAQKAKVDALGLARRLDLVLLTDAKGRAFWKPHPWAFQQASTELCVKPAQCIYVADNPAKDFVAPNRLGWQTVQVCRPGGIYEHASPPPGGAAGHHVGDLRELARILG